MMTTSHILYDDTALPHVWANEIPPQMVLLTPIHLRGAHITILNLERHSLQLHHVEMSAFPLVMHPKRTRNSNTSGPLNNMAGNRARYHYSLNGIPRNSIEGVRLNSSKVEGSMSLDALLLAIYS